MKIFLTGATGFVGGRMARLLVQRGHQVHAVVRTPAKAADLAALGVHLHPGDVTAKESMRAAMTGAEAVLHIAGWYKVGVRDTREGHAINVTGTRHVLELMQELNVPKGVYTSTLAVNSNTHGQLVDETHRYTGPHLSVYDQTKAEAHHVAEAFVREGLPLVIVQPGLIYGPGDTSSARTTLVNYLKRRLPVIPQVTAFAWAHVDDIAEAHWLALEKGRPGENYFICGETHTLVAALQLAQTITGVPAPASAPPALFGALSKLSALVEPFLTLPESYTAEDLRVVAGTTYIGNNAKARRELGYAPRPLVAGLRETLHHEMRLLGMKV